MARNCGLGLDSLGFGRVGLSLSLIAGSNGFATAFDKNVTLERILSRETLVAVIARERLDCQMDPLMTLQVVIPIEALWALITLERSIVRSGLLMLRVPHEMRHGRTMSTVKAGHHRMMDSNKRKLAIRVLDIRVNWRGS